MQRISTLVVQSANRSQFCQSAGRSLFSQSGERKILGQSAIRRMSENGAGKIENSCAPALSPIANAKKVAAYHAVDNYVKDGQVLGIGTGSTAKFLVERLAEKVGAGTLKDIQCVPSSFAARHLLIQKGLPLSDLDRTPNLDLCIDGADEVDPKLTCIKGGGGCLTQEKIVQTFSQRFIIIADSTKEAPHLGSSYPNIPIEVVQVAATPLKERIEKIEGGTCSLRMAESKAGPVVTDNGNFILDWAFPKTPAASPDFNWTTVHERIKLLPGVVETGLFIEVAELAIYGMPDGQVKTVRPA